VPRWTMYDKTTGGQASIADTALTNNTMTADKPQLSNQEYKPVYAADVCE